jgi:amidophosphoribosyltransferase
MTTRPQQTESDDKPHEECGVFGVFGHPDASKLTFLGLYALQHRGQESAGIVSCDGNTLYQHRGMGLVVNVFADGSLDRLEGHMAVGHNRYSTSGSSSLQNAQPFVAQYQRGPLAIAHNGNLVNAFRIRRELEEQGQIFTTSSDTEVLTQLIARSRQEFLEDRLIDALKEVRGAYSLLALGKKALVGARDPSGFRPLWIGRLGDATILASETCAIDAVEGEILREVEPGELVLVTREGMRTIHLPVLAPRAHCIFEFLYLARNDSYIFGESVAGRRLEFGKQLARECPADADIVVPMPDSANMAALGYAEESGIPFRFGLARNQYVGRTFIQPSQQQRTFQVGVKINPIREVVAGKRVVLIDDSIMRGTTLRKMCKQIRLAGATSVHVRIAAPPTRFPCFYGIDIPTRQELIASNHTLDEVCKYIRADSLGYLSIPGMLKCVRNPHSYCAACFDGEYRIEFSGQNIQQLSIDFTRNRTR